MNHFDLLQLFNEEAPPAEPQGETGAPAQPQTEPADPAAEFETLIRGKYKQAYEARLKDTLHRRLRGSRETVERYNALSPAINLLARHYGVDASDTAALSRAVESDDSFYQAQAERLGMAPRELRAIRQLEQENAALRQRSRQEFARQQALRWEEQARQTREKYPDFRLEQEYDDPLFRQLLHSGVDVSRAYLAIHADELLTRAAETAREKLAGQYTGTLRPSENGAAAATAGRIRSDVASMSRSEREAIRRRAARGERIRL